MREWLSRTWCAWMHGGGQIERDAHGRIDWRCARCGRWSGKPVPLTDEQKVVDRNVAECRTSTKKLPING